MLAITLLFVWFNETWNAISLNPVKESEPLLIGQNYKPSNSQLFSVF